MKITFTKEFMQSNKGCYSSTELNACSFMAKDEITLASIIDSEIPTNDKYWFVCRKLLNKEQNQNLSLGVASIVEGIYAKKYPNDYRVKECIEATQGYLDGTVSLETLKEKRAAAAASAAAAYAAAAAYTAAAAAAAAAAAVAYAAASASAAAAYAAYAAAADADHKELARICKQALIDYLIFFLESEGL